MLHPPIRTRQIFFPWKTSADQVKLRAAGKPFIMKLSITQVNEMDEAAWFQRQNDAYHARFGFPFIICVRANRKQSIKDGFLARLDHSAEAEMHAALGEIDKIAAFRLSDLVAP